MALVSTGYYSESPTSSLNLFCDTLSKQLLRDKVCSFELKS